MGTRTKTTTGVFFWTPAPACSSPGSSAGSEGDWENDFDLQMDDDGIIGLTGAVRAARLEDWEDAGEGKSPQKERAAVLVKDEGNESQRTEAGFNQKVPEIFSQHLPAGEASNQRSPGEPAEQKDHEFHQDFTERLVDPSIPADLVMSYKESNKDPSTWELNSEKVESRTSRLPKARSLLPSSCPSISSSSRPRESRKGNLGFRIPNFSKVEPRVRFPKGDYKPPKSRQSSTKTSLSPQPSLAHKPPEDMLREILVKQHVDQTTDEKLLPADDQTRESQSPEQTCTLMDQLQDDYNNLLIKYAEAENTIDRLRLEAKVRINYSFPPPIQSVESQANNNTSKFLSLSFPQAQRANNALPSVTQQQGECSAASSPASTTQSSQSQLGQELSNILCTQADKFLQQLQVFDDLLKEKKLKSRDQISGLSRLHQGLSSLEKSYLTAKNHEKSLLQQLGEPFSHFDPDRELEELILQCGQHMEELKKHVETPPPRLERPSPSSGPSSRRKQKRMETSPGDPVESTPESVSSEDDGFRLNSVYLKPPNGYEDADLVTDHSQNYDIQKPLKRDEEEKVLSAAVQTDEFWSEGNEGFVCAGLESSHDDTVQHSVEDSVEQSFNFDENDKRHVVDLKVESVRKSQTEFDHSDVLPASVAKKHSGKLTCAPLEDFSSPSIYPLGSCKKSHVFKSQSRSLDLASSESPKAHRGMRKVLSQDGVVSPETDSGFVGSESSRLNLAASSVRHQRAPKRQAPVHLEVDSPETVTESSSVSRRVWGPTRPSTSGSEGARTHQRSPVNWMKTTMLESSDRSDGRSDRSPEYSIDPYMSSRGSTPVAQRRCHDDAVNAARCNQVLDKDVIHELQAELNRLHDKIRSSLDHPGPVGAARAPVPHASTPRHRLSDSSGEEVRPARQKKSLRKHTTRTRSGSASRRKQAHTMSSSEPERSSWPLQVTRSTQTAAPDRRAAPPVAVSSSSQTPRQDPGVSAEVKGQVAPCQHCLVHLSPRSNGPAGGDRERVPSTSPHCPRCGQQDSRSAETDRRQNQGSSNQGRSRPADTLAPPTFVQCVPVCSSSVLLYPNLQPVFMSPGGKTDSEVKVQPRKFRKKSVRRSPSPADQSLLSDSLDRAIRAARTVKRTSRHIVHSLASDLQHQDLHHSF